MNKNHMPLTVATRQPWWEPTEQELRDEERKGWENLGVRKSTPQMCKGDGSQVRAGKEGQRSRQADDLNLPVGVPRAEGGGGEK